MVKNLKKSKNGSATVEYIFVSATIIGFILVALNTSGFFTNSLWYVLNSSAWSVGNAGDRIHLGSSILSGTQGDGGSMYSWENPPTASMNWGNSWGGDCNPEEGCPTVTGTGGQ